MANVAHSTLTGADLHEPKGIAAASADKVYVSNGAGSGTWTALSTAIPGDSFAQHISIIDAEAQGQNGGTFTSGSWVTRDLSNIMHTNISGASLTTNTITLPSGHYYCIASAPAFGVGKHKIRLWNNTDSEVLATGTSECAGTVDGTQTRSEIAVWITFSGTKAVKLQHMCETTKTTNGLGVASNFSGMSETYAMITLWKFPD